jgi:predicted O-linked N-acetylglucosamine transferase (SPINDLY family)
MNNNHKYTEEMFECWLRIIKSTNDSILWLLSDNDFAKRNMVSKAKEHNVDDRLFFTERLIPADYLARYKVIDLFLDTYPFNGGTTVNDALFMGTPLLTLSGRTFSSRMGGAILKFNQSTGWIAKSIKEYEKIGIKVRNKKPNKAEIKYKYNTYNFTRSLETQLIKINSKDSFI